MSEIPAGQPLYIPESNPLERESRLLGYGRADLTKAGIGAIALASLLAEPEIVPETWIGGARSYLQQLEANSGIITKKEQKPLTLERAGYDLPLVQPTIKNNKYTDPELLINKIDKQMNTFYNMKNNVAQSIAKTEKSGSFTIPTQGIPQFYNPVKRAEPQKNMGLANGSATPDRSEQMSAARAYRRDKLRFGALGDFIGQIPQNPKMRAAVKPFLMMRDALASGTQADDEHHRDLTALLSGLVSGSHELKHTAMEHLDQSATQRSNELKAEAQREGVLKADVVIIGGGLQGSVAAAQLRAEKPNARIIAIDSQPKLGGQFRKYGQRPVFYINSRTHRPQDNSNPTNLPSGYGNINTVGNTAPVQLTDIAKETYPTNEEFGNTAAINHYLSADTMLETTAYDVNDQDGVVTARDTVSGEVYSIKGENILVIPGFGERINDNPSDNVLSAEQLLSHFANSDQAFPMERFVGKRVAVIGGGDTGRIVNELLARLGPPEAYGNSVVQLGGPSSINWFGTDFNNRDEFCDTNRPRYQQLASFIGDRDDILRKSLITPDPEKVTSVTPTLAGSVRINTPSNTDFFDIVIDARTFPNTLDTAQALVDAELAPDYMFSELGRLNVGRRTASGRTYVLGPAAQASLSLIEQASFADGITENTASAWANTPRVATVAKNIARRLELASQ